MTITFQRPSAAARYLLNSRQVHACLAEACAAARGDPSSGAADYAKTFGRFHQEQTATGQEIRTRIGSIARLDEGRVHRALVLGCANSWQTNTIKQHENAARPYTLYYLPFHLHRGGLVSELYDLARSEVFLADQERSFPAQPDLPLRTVQTARDVAIEADDPARMAEFVLREVGFWRQMHQVDPWQLMDAGNAEGALNLTRRMAPLRRSVWLLGLLHHPKFAATDMERSVLSELRQTRRTLPDRTMFFQPIEQTLLLLWYPALARHDPNLLVDLQVKTLDDSSRSFLCERLVAEGSHSTALQVARGIHGVARPRLLGLVAEALARSASPEAVNAFEAALASAQELTNSTVLNLGCQRSIALAGVVEALERSGRPQTAKVIQETLTCARHIGHAYTRAHALAALAVALGRNGNAQALQVCRLALASAREIDGGNQRSALRSEALVKVAKALAETAEVMKQNGSPDHWLVFREASSCAWEAAYTEDRVVALASVAEAMARSGSARGAALFQEALECARDLQYGRPRSLAFVAGALGRAAHQEAAQVLHEALVSTRNFNNPLYELKEVLEAVGVGDFIETSGIADVTLAHVRDVEDANDRVHALVMVADKLTRSGSAKATQVCREALACEQNNLDEYPPSLALALFAVADELERKGHSTSTSMLQQALACARRIRNPNDPVIALATIAESLERRGNPEAANVLEETLACAKKECEYEPDYVQVLAVVGTVLGRSGSVKGAQLFQEALACAQDLINEYPLSSVLHNLGRLAKRGSYTGSEEWANALEAALTCARKLKYGRSEALAGVATAMRRSGSPNAAQAFREAQQSFQETASGSVSALTEMMACGEWSTEAEILRDFLACVEGGEDSSRARACFTTALMLGGNVETAGAFQEAWTIALETSQDFFTDRPGHLARLAVVCGEKGNPKPLRLFMPVFASHPESAWAAAGALARVYPEQAVAIAEAIRPFIGKRENL